MLDEGKDIEVDRNAKQSNKDLDKGILAAKNTQDIQSAINGMTTLATLISSTVGIIQTLMMIACLVGKNLKELFLL